MINSRNVVEECNNGLQKKSMQHILWNERTECNQSEIRNESTECNQSEMRNESTECNQSEIRNQSTECNQSEIRNEITECIQSEIRNESTECKRNNIMEDKSGIETDISNIDSTNPIEFVDYGLSSSDQMEEELKVRRSKGLKISLKGLISYLKVAF